MENKTSGKCVGPTHSISRLHFVFHTQDERHELSHRIASLHLQSFCRAVEPR